MNVSVEKLDELVLLINKLSPEKSRRILLSAAAEAYGHGGKRRVKELTGIAYSTMRRGLADAEAERLKAESHRALADDECYRCLLTIPGIGPVCAEALVSLVDISLFESHHKLASLCGLAPADSKSGSSIDGSSTPRSGNKELKNLLIFTVNSLVGTDNYFGRYYDKVLEGTKGEPKVRRKKALKAVARKRLKVIYAVMRDLVPYDPSKWEKRAS